MLRNTFQQITFDPFTMTFLNYIFGVGLGSNFPFCVSFTLVAQPSSHSSFFLAQVSCTSIVAFVITARSSRRTHLGDGHVWRPVPAVFPSYMYTYTYIFECVCVCALAPHIYHVSCAVIVVGNIPQSSSSPGRASGFNPGRGSGGGPNHATRRPRCRPSFLQIPANQPVYASNSFAFGL